MFFLLCCWPPYGWPHRSALQVEGRLPSATGVLRTAARQAPSRSGVDRLSGEDLVNHFAPHVGQAEVAAGVAIGKILSACSTGAMPLTMLTSK